MLILVPKFCPAECAVASIKQAAGVAHGFSSGPCSALAAQNVVSDSHSSEIAL